MRKIFLIIVPIGLFFSGCSVFNTVQNIGRLKYRIQSTENYRIIGINVDHKKSLKDFTPVELLKFSAAIAKGSLPATFTINVEAVNPNDGNGGYPRTDINIIKFPWRLFLNDKEIVDGNISSPVYVPGKGESVIIPLQVQIDIMKLIKEKSFEDIIALIQRLGGIHGTTTNIKLLVKPGLGTPMGNIEYPDEITIADKSFN
jgi:hypothetical protein